MYIGPTRPILAANNEKDKDTAKDRVKRQRLSGMHMCVYMYKVDDHKIAISALIVLGLSGDCHVCIYVHIHICIYVYMTLLKTELKDKD
jgi:hypothetical protein